MIQPTRKAIQIARKIAGALHVEPDDRKILDIAAALEAYAIERIAQRDPTYDQLRAERDAAIARAEAAEAEAIRWKMQFESTNAAGIGVVEKLAVAEERVRVLEAAIRKARQETADALECASCHNLDDECAFPIIMTAIDELAKAAGGQEVHDG